VLAAVLLGTAAGVPSCASSDDEVDGVPESPGGTEQSHAFSVKVWTADGSKLQPLEGATILLDRGPIRVEATTNVNGVARFVGVDPRRTSTTVTSYKQGYQLVSAFDVGDLVTKVAKGTVLELTTHNIAPRVVTAFGIATGMHDASDVLRVSASIAPSTQYEGTGPGWWLDVPSGKPFKVVGIDLGHAVRSEPNGLARQVFGWAGADVNESTRWIGLDFDQSLIPEVIDGSFPVVEHAGAPAYLPGTTASVEVYGKDFAPSVGLATKTWREPVRNHWHFAVEYVRVLPVSDVFYRISQRGPHSALTGQTRSSAYFKGYPQSGEIDIALPAAPELTMVEASGLASRISWQAQGHDTVNGIQIHQGGPEGPVVWELSVHAGRSSMVLPTLPSSAELDPVLKAPLTLNVRHCEIDLGFDPQLCKVESISKAVPLFRATAAAATPSEPAQQAPGF